MIDAGIIDQETQNGGTSNIQPDHLLLYRCSYLFTHKTEESPKSTCPFVFYGQLEPSSVPEVLMQEFEEEVQRPTGRWTIPPPKLSVRGVLMSKECGVLYEVVNTEGLRCVLSRLSRSWEPELMSFAQLPKFFS